MLTAGRTIGHSTCDGVNAPLPHSNVFVLTQGRGGVSRDVLEGGEGRGDSEGGGGAGGFGPDPLPPRVPLWSPPKAGQQNIQNLEKNLTLTPLGTEGAEAKIWLSASNIGRGGGSRGGGGGGLSSSGVRPF